MLSTSSRESDESGPLLSGDIIESMKEGRIGGYECLECGTRGIEVQVYCARCGSPRLRTITMSNIGRVVTYTIVQIAPEQFMNEAPYAWAVIELDGGVRTSGRIPFINSPHNLKIGQKVRMIRSSTPGMVFEKIPD